MSSIYGNFLGGPISPALAKLVHLNYLDLEENSFAGLPKGHPSLECKTPDDLKALYRAVGFEDTYRREVKTAAKWSARPVPFLQNRAPLSCCLTRSKPVTVQIAKEKERQKEKLERELRADAAAAAMAAAEAAAAEYKSRKGSERSGQPSEREAKEDEPAVSAARSKANAEKLAEEAAQQLARERPALIGFGDATGRLACWNDSTGWAAREVSDNWFGLGLDTRGTGRVAAISLAGNGLTGDLSRAGDALFPALGKLLVLDLRANQLSGRIPASLGLLNHLVELYLSLNKLVGSIPAE